MEEEEKWFTKICGECGQGFHTDPKLSEHKKKHSDSWVSNTYERRKTIKQLVHDKTFGDSRKSRKQSKIKLLILKGKKKKRLGMG